MPVEVVQGDLFDPDNGATIFVNAVNCVGVMGKGIAADFKRRYPDMFIDYEKRCRAGGMKPGTLHVFKDWDVIINFPTKRHWREKSKLNDIRDGLKSLREYLAVSPSKVIVAMPAVGCGEGGLDWYQVGQLVKDYLNDLPCKVLLYEPRGTSAKG